MECYREVGMVSQLWLWLPFWTLLSAFRHVQKAQLLQLDCEVWIDYLLLKVDPLRLLLLCVAFVLHNHMSSVHEFEVCSSPYDFHWMGDMQSLLWWRTLLVFNWHIHTSNKNRDFRNLKPRTGKTHRLEIQALIVVNKTSRNHPYKTLRQLSI